MSMIKIIYSSQNAFYITGKQKYLIEKGVSKELLIQEADISLIVNLHKDKYITINKESYEQLTQALPVEAVAKPKETQAKLEEPAVVESEQPATPKGNQVGKK